MGALRTARGKPEDPVMEEQRKTETFQEVTPYRLQALMDLAARVVKLMTTGRDGYCAELYPVWDGTESEKEPGRRNRGCF